MKRSEFCTVLVVDDCEEDREVYAAYLRSARGRHYTVLEAADVSEGLQICGRVRVDCVLLDYDMPDKDGVDFLRALRAFERDTVPPVVMITGQGSAAIAVDVMKLGAIDYLPKDKVTADKLVQMTQVALERLQEKHAVAQQDQQALLEQRRLRENEERYRALVESVQAYAIIMLDERARVVSWNAGARQMFNLHDQEILGQPADQLFAGAEGPSAAQATQRARTEPENGFVFLRPMQRKDGQDFFAHCVVSVMQFGRPQTNGYSLVVRQVQGGADRPPATYSRNLGPCAHVRARRCRGEGWRGPFRRPSEQTGQTIGAQPRRQRMTPRRASRRRRRAARALQRIEQNLSTSPHLQDALCAGEPNLTEVFGHGGVHAAARIGGRWSLLGQLPDPARLDAWLQNLATGKGHDLALHPEPEGPRCAGKRLSRPRRSVLVLPMKNEGQDYLLWFRQRGTWTRLDQRIARTLRRMLHQARLAGLVRRERERVEALEGLRTKARVLGAASRAIVGARDLDQPHTEVCAQLAKAFGDGCLVYAPDLAQGWRLVAVSHRTAQGRAILDQLPQDGPHAPTCAALLEGCGRNGGFVRERIADAWAAATWPEQTTRHKLTQRLGLASIAVARLGKEPGPLGVLLLTRPGTQKVFAADDLSVLLEIARQCSDAAQILTRLSLLRRDLEDHDRAVAVIAHDLKSPATAISLATGSILRRLEKQGVEPQAAITSGLGRIQASSRRMFALLDDLTTSGKFAEEGVVLQKRTVSAQDTFRDALVSAAALAEAKGVALLTAAPPEAIELTCDPAQMAKVFANLLGNPVKFTPKGGTVTLEVARTRDAHVRFTVRDTGPGLRRQDLPRVFDRYWQSTDAASQGTGLGLYIAKTIVCAHGGAITADVANSPATGAIFQLELTCEPASALP